MSSKDAQLYLKTLNLEVDDISIQFNIEIDKMRLEQDASLEFDRFFAKYTVFESDESEIGLASFYVVDATQIHVSDLRDIADGKEFHLYETLSSVRIFFDELNSEIEKEHGYKDYYENETTDFILGMKEKMKVIKQQGFSPYPEGFEQYTFEDQPYHEETIDIWGKILVLDDIEFYSLFNKPFLTEALFNQLCESLKYLGYFDWLIVNPNIDDPAYFANNNYPVSNMEQYNALLEKFGFAKTHGKLHNNRFCYCMMLKPH